MQISAARSHRVNGWEASRDESIPVTDAARGTPGEIESERFPARGDCLEETGGCII
jgi:hypothetical protein